MSIQSFKNIEIQHFFEKAIVPNKAEWQNVSKIALRKLDMINSAKNENGFEIGAFEVEIIDYHF